MIRGRPNACTTPNYAAGAIVEFVTTSAPVPPSRPALSPEMDAAEFSRWYWTVAELRPFAQTLGVSSAGVKAELSARIAAALRGDAPTVAPASPARQRLTPPLTRATVIPAGVVLSRELRDWFVAEIGPQFHSDQHMRDFLRTGAGRTLGDAVDHWYATRDAPRPEIGAQFELNRFTREWRSANPGGSREELLAAWAQYRATPSDLRD